MSKLPYPHEQLERGPVVVDVGELERDQRTGQRDQCWKATVRQRDGDLVPTRYRYKQNKTKQNKITEPRAESEAQHWVLALVNVSQCPPKRGDIAHH